MATCASDGIVVENVNFTYRSARNTTAVFHDFCCQFSKSKVYALLGRSGTGKTTLLKLLCGILQPAGKGKVSIDGQSVAEAVKQRVLGFLSQDTQPAPWLTVLENLFLPLKLIGSAPGRDSEVQDVLERIGLADMLNRFPAELSGGERRRLMIAMSIIHRPRYVLLDEPFRSLDAKTRLEMYGFLAKVQEISWNATGQQNAGAIILVTHNIEEAAILGDEVLIVARTVKSSLPSHPNRLDKNDRQGDLRGLRERAEFREYIGELEDAL